MKILIILAILVVAYLVYRAFANEPDETPVAPESEIKSAEEVSMPNEEFKNAIQIAAGVAVLIILLIAAAFLL